MGRMSLATRSRVVSLWKSRLTLSKIQKRLLEENLYVSKKSLCVLIQKYRKTGSVADYRPTKPPKKLKEDHYRFIDQAMAENDELSISRLHQKLVAEFPALMVSQSTVKRARRELGWVAKRTRYCALISEVNTAKRLEWCRQQQESGDLEFNDVLWSDECTVQLESHRRITFRKERQPVTYRMKPKHPPKINIWAGISRRGATNVVIFSGTLTATCYVDILEIGLLPFLETYYPDGHRFQQDNDPKHTSRYAQWWYSEKGVNWFHTPAASPDLNSIELIWHSLKDYLRIDYKPKNLTELKAGIKAFWATLTPEICCKFIGHLKKVIPKVIEAEGGPSGY